MDNPPDFNPSFFPSILTDFEDGSWSVSSVNTAIHITFYNEKLFTEVRVDCLGSLPSQLNLKKYTSTDIKQFYSAMQ